MQLQMVGRGAPPCPLAAMAPDMDLCGGGGDADEKLRKCVLWLNTEDGFDGAFDHDAIAYAAHGLPIAEVLRILTQPEENVRNLAGWAITSYFCAALRKMGGGRVAGGVGLEDCTVLPAEFPEGKSLKLSKRIRWLNGQGGFEGQIDYDRIIEAAHGLKDAHVVQVLQVLEEKRGEVNDPTAWICAALRRYGAGDAAVAAASSKGRFAMSGGGMPPGLPAVAFGRAKPRDCMDAYEWHEDTKLRKRIGWLNNHGFDNSLSYDKVADSAAGLGIGHVLEVLKKLERMAKFRNLAVDPTFYVVAALHRKRRLVGRGARRTIAKK